MPKTISEIALRGKLYEETLGKAQRRQGGIFYTPPEVAAEVVRTALEPVLAERRTAEAVTALTLCDPACGGGVFLLEACRQLAEHLAAVTKTAGGPGMPFAKAKKRVAAACLTGVDRDPGAVALARESLALYTGMEPAVFTRVVCADSLAAWNDPAVFPAKGVDVLLGNPPFLGGRKIRRMLGDAYFEFLTRRFAPGVSGNADLCAFFLRLAGKVVRPGGVCGFITTNTVAEGDTRRAGLDFLVHEKKATIFHARNHLGWPGDAAVSVAVVHLRFPDENAVETDENNTPRAENDAVNTAFPCMLNGVRVRRISPSLRETDADAEPHGRTKIFEENKTLCFQGHVLAGKGFLLAAAEAEELFRRNPKNRDVIFPYFTGEEVFHQARLNVTRMVIHFQDWPLERAEMYPEALAILREKVLPVRENVRRKRHRDLWWRFGDARPVLTRILQENAFSRMLVQTRHSKHFSPTFVETGFPRNAIFSESAVIFPSDSPLLLAVLNSTVHEIWARRMSSSLGRELRYTPTQAFYTFPFPFPSEALRRADACPDETCARNLFALGENLHALRMEIQEKKGLGISPIYDLLHDPAVTDAEITRLRDVHVQINAAVMAAYKSCENLAKMLGNSANYEFHPTHRGIRWGIPANMEKHVMTELLKNIPRESREKM